MGRYNNLISDIDFSLESKIENDKYNAGKHSNGGKSVLNPLRNATLEQQQEWGRRAGRKAVESGQIADFSKKGYEATNVEHQCPHCNVRVKGRVYFRHHGDNCKLIDRLDDFISDTNNMTYKELQHKYGLSFDAAKNVINNNK